MKGTSEMRKELEKLGYKVIASHTTANGLRIYANAGNKQVIKIDIDLDAKQEVETLLKHRPFFKASVIYNLQEE